MSIVTSLSTVFHYTIFPQNPREPICLDLWVERELLSNQEIDKVLEEQYWVHLIFFVIFSHLG
jgi:hypothetical protein